MAPGWRDPDKYCCRCWWEGAAAPCAAARAIPLAAALDDSVCSLGSGILTPGQPHLLHGEQDLAALSTLVLWQWALKSWVTRLASGGPWQEGGVHPQGTPGK